MRIIVLRFKANGDRLNDKSIRAAFYGLVINGYILEYFTTFAAVKLAIASVRMWECQDADTVITEFEFRQVA